MDIGLRALTPFSRKFPVGLGRLRPCCKRGCKRGKRAGGAAHSFGCAYQPHCPARRGVSSVPLKTSTAPSCPPRLFYEIFWDAVTACNVGFGLSACATKLLIARWLYGHATSYHVILLKATNATVRMPLSVSFVSFVSFAPSPLRLSVFARTKFARC